MKQSEEYTFEILKTYADFYDDELAILTQVNLQNKHSVKVNWVTTVLVTSGNSVCLINDVPHHVTKNDLLVCLPDQILDMAETSDDFQFSCLCISRRILERIATYSSYTWDAITFLHSHPVLKLNEKESNHFSYYYELFREKLQYQRAYYHYESMRCLLQAFMYDFYEVLERFVAIDQLQYSSGKNLFRNFLNIMSDMYPKNRSVSFYADKLHVTSKYLSAVCKANSGMTASDLINKAVMRDIAQLLVYSTKSIKEIMIELDFPSLSFFGKYVKKHFGVGPKEFRAIQSAKHDIENHH